MTTAAPTAADHGVQPWRGIAVGCVAGALSGLFGIGGGIVIVPGLMAIASMERRLAHGTSLGATLPIAIASFLTYTATGNVDWPVAAALASGAIVGAVIGTQLLQTIPKRPLVVLFIVTILATAFRLVLADETGGRSGLTVLAVVALVLVGLLTGTLSGLLGIGGGVVMVPAMIVLFSMTPVVAKGTSVAVIVASSTAGTLRNRSHRNVDLRTAALVGGAGVVFAVAGSLVSDAIDDTVSNALFAVLLLVVAGLQINSLRTGRA